MRTEIASVRAALLAEIASVRDGLRTEIAAVRTPAADGGTAELPVVDRAALVAGLADQIRDAISSGERWAPDYDALMERTGFRRSWCEKAVRDARTQAFAAPHDTGRTDQDRTDSARYRPGRRGGLTPTTAARGAARIGPLAPRPGPHQEESPSCQLSSTSARTPPPSRPGPAAVTATPTCCS